MTTALAASTVLALAGSSHGFISTQFAIQSNASLTPSSGSFYQKLNFYGTKPYATGNLVTGAASNWKNYSGYMDVSTWLAADRNGAGGVFSASTGLAAERPEWNDSSGNQLGAGVLETSGTTIATIPGGGPGYSWGAGSTANFEAPSAISNIAGVGSVDSIFFGQFVFTDPAAVLTGAPLLATIDGVNQFIPLDGSKGSGGFAIVYEEFQTGGRKALRGFVVVPTPGAAGLLGIAGLAAIRRRR